MLRVLLYPQEQRAFIPIFAKWRLQLFKMCIFPDEFDPLRQLAAGKLKTSLFLEEFDPLRQFQLAGGGGDESSLLLRVQQYP